MRGARLAAVLDLHRSVKLARTSIHVISTDVSLSSVLADRNPVLVGSSGARLGMLSLRCQVPALCCLDLPGGKGSILVVLEETLAIP